MTGVQEAVPISGNAVTKPVDAVTRHATLSQDLLCYLSINSFQSGQGVALDLRAIAKLSEDSKVARN